MGRVSRLWPSAVAGYFYPGQAEALREALARLTPATGSLEDCTAAIVPHASYSISGSVAGHTFARVRVPRRCIVLGANHTGGGAGWALLEGGAYRTPLGEIAIDDELSEQLARRCQLIEIDETPHRGEHSIDMQLPWLQWLGPADVSVVSVVVRSAWPQEADDVAAALADVVQAAGEPVLLIASSDLTHHEPAASVARKDARLLEVLTGADAGSVLKCIASQRATVCGAGALAAVAWAARRLGSASGQVVRRATSAEAGGDPGSATGYAGVIYRNLGE